MTGGREGYREEGDGVLDQLAHGRGVLRQTVGRKKGLNAGNAVGAHSLEEETVLLSRLRAPVQLGDTGQRLMYLAEEEETQGKSAVLLAQFEEVETKDFAITTGSVIGDKEDFLRVVRNSLVITVVLCVR